MYNRFASVRQKQTQGQLESVIGGILLKSHRADSEENMQKVRDHINKKMDGEWSSENVRLAVQHLGCNLTPAVRNVRPLDRDITPEEATQFAEKVLRANPWVDINDESNGQLLMQTFFSMQTSPRKDLNDMKEALRIVASRMKRTPPPPPPKFQDEDLTQRLADGSSKLPLNPNAMHQSQTRLQRLNLIERLRKKEAWDADH